jgi:hypothetical protein
MICPLLVRGSIVKHRTLNSIYSNRKLPNIENSLLPDGVRPTRSLQLDDLSIVSASSPAKLVAKTDIYELAGKNPILMCGRY